MSSRSASRSASSPAVNPNDNGRPFASVLIANRGEIAVRVIIACQEMGIRAIAVYSDADNDALHVRMADAAYRIGPAPARESYLDIAAILAAAREAGAEAIHPGYGFLSENAEFAAACAEVGIVFIGPPPEAIRLMGSKTAAKRAVERVGVPTVPGYLGDAQSGALDAGTLRREAERIGYPLMLKAAAGGGGKGMRVVHTPDEFAESLAAAQREALAAFGDESVFLEKLIVAPRHVEFQMLADRYGHTIHLGERECSIQRRHQKVLEESPCVALTPELRAEMGEAAVRAAAAVGYVNAGTCEFLLDGDGRYYFLEMNTRLQVEHPITEAVMGYDLVRHQLAIAAGQPLSLAQADVAPRGHAIEVRLYAEDPANGYLPSSGQVLAFAPPRAPGVRVDAGVATGDEVSVNYDPMLAKLIVSAEDRPAAIQRLRWALDSFATLGVVTNTALLRAIADDADFQAGRTNTAFLETHDLGAALQPPPTLAPLIAVAAALWETLSATTMPAATSAATPASHAARGPFNPWTRGAMLGGSAGGERRFRYTTPDGQPLLVTVRATGAPGAQSSYTATLNGEPYPADGASLTATLGQNGALALAIGVARETVYVARRGYELLVWAHGASYTLARPRPLDVETAAHSGEIVTGAQTLTAPMAGTIIKVNVAPGDVVEARQTLVVLGAMKMEHAITAPQAGRVTTVAHTAGEVVSGGALLVTLAPLDVPTDAD